MPFLAQIFLAVGLTGWLSWRNSQRAIADLAQQLQTDVDQRIQQHLRSYLDRPHTTNQQTLNAIRLGLIHPDRPQELRRFFLQTLQTLPEVNTLQVGRPNGTYVGVGRWNDGNYGYVLKQADPQQSRDFLVYGLREDNRPGDLLQIRPDYVLQKRVWYANTVQQQRSLWSPIYVMYSSGLLGLTLTEPILNDRQQLQGVIGTDILLSDLGTFLGSLQLGKNGQAFIMERSGLLVASSTQLDPLQRSQTNPQAPPQRLAALQSGDVLIQNTTQYLQRHFGDLSRITQSNHQRFQADRQTYFLQVTPFQDRQSLDWLVVVVIPEGDFLGKIQANNRTTILLCIVALGIATGVGILTSRWVTSPILDLSQAAADLADGGWQADPIQAWRAEWFYETAHLATAFNVMRQELQRSFGELEHRVEERTAALKHLNEQLRQEIHERQRIQQALVKSEMKFRTLFETSQVGMFRTRLQDGLILDANHYFVQLLGYQQKEEVIGKVSAQDYYANPGIRIQVLTQVEESGEIHNFETEFCRADRSSFWVLLSARLNPQENCLEAVVTDISDRLYMEAAVRQSEAMYRDLIQTANCIIIRLSPEGYLLFMNGFGEEFFGYSLGQLVGMNLLGTQLLDIPRTKNLLKQLLYHISHSPQEYANLEVEHTRSNGDRVWVAWSNRPIFDLQGHLREILAVGIDISDRKRAEKRLQEQEEYLRLILDNIPQQVFWKNTDLVFLGCNKNWAQSAYLKGPEEVIGKTDFDLLPSADVAAMFREQDLKIMQSGKPVLHVIAQKQRPAADGSPIWLDINKIPMQNREGKVIGILGVLEDITQRKLAEEALEAERQKSEALLLNVLPQAIAEKLKEEQTAIAESFESVSILFADIVGFTSLSTQLPPQALVNFLNQVFSTFDQLAEKHQLEKIKTLGDAYMVVGGLPLPRTDHALAIAQMALDMQGAIQTLPLQSLWPHINALGGGDRLKIRIGINSGSVIAGVIGKKKFIYDLWGDAVNIASRMESSGEPNMIQITESTYHLVKDHFHCQARGPIEVKGRGTMVTYWLLAP